MDFISVLKFEGAIFFLQFLFYSSQGSCVSCLHAYVMVTPVYVYVYVHVHASVSYFAFNGLCVMGSSISHFHPAFSPSFFTSSRDAIWHYSFLWSSI